MRFGLSVTPGVDAPDRVRLAEEAGFDEAIFVDSPVIFGDAYVSMAACAVQTQRIRLLPGVTNPVIRTAPITASNLASLNALAPGRIAMGIGVGFTGTGAMGLRSASLDRLERYVGEVRGLLRGDVVEVAMTGRSIPMQFLNPHRPFIELFDRLPVYMAAAGPRALEVAGRIADCVILGGITQPEVIEACRAIVDRGAREAGRSAGDIEIAVTPRVYLTDEAGAGFEQLREVLGPKVLGPAANFSRVAESSESVPRSLVQAFVAARDAYKPAVQADDPDARTRHLRAFRGYTAKLQPWQYELVTPEVLAATTIAGTPQACMEKLRRLAGCGVTLAILSTAAEQINEVIDVFGRDIIPHFSGAAV